MKYISYSVIFLLLIILVAPSRVASQGVYGDMRVKGILRVDTIMADDSSSVVIVGIVFSGTRVDTSTYADSSGLIPIGSISQRGGYIVGTGLSATASGVLSVTATGGGVEAGDTVGVAELDGNPSDKVRRLIFPNATLTISNDTVFIAMPTRPEVRDTANAAILDSLTALRSQAQTVTGIWRFNADTAFFNGIPFKGLAAEPDSQLITLARAQGLLGDYLSLGALGDSITNTTSKIPTAIQADTALGSNFSTSSDTTRAAASLGGIAASEYATEAFVSVTIFDSSHIPIDTLEINKVQFIAFIQEHQNETAIPGSVDTLSINDSLLVSQIYTTSEYMNIRPTNKFNDDFTLEIGSNGSNQKLNDVILIVATSYDEGAIANSKVTFRLWPPGVTNYWDIITDTTATYYPGKNLTKLIFRDNNSTYMSMQNDSIFIPLVKIGKAHIDTFSNKIDTTGIIVAAFEQFIQEHQSTVTGGVSAGDTVRVLEIDGSPTQKVRSIAFTNGTVSISGDTATINITAGSGILSGDTVGVAESDGDPAGKYTVLIFPNTSVSASNDTATISLVTRTEARDTANAAIRDSLLNHYKKLEIRSMLRDSIIMVKALMEAKTDTAEVRAILSDSLLLALRKAAFKDSIENTTSVIDSAGDAAKLGGRTPSSYMLASALPESVKAVDSMSVTFQTKPITEIQWAYFYPDTHYVVDNKDTIEIFFSRDSIAGRLASMTKARYPDTGAVQTIQFSSGIINVPLEYSGIDSITVFIHTTFNTYDSNSVRFDAYEVDVNDAETWLDSTATAFTNNAWTYDKNMASLAALGKGDRLRLVATIRSKRMEAVVSFGRGRICWKVGW